MTELDPVTAGLVDELHRLRQWQRTASDRHNEIRSQLLDYLGEDCIGTVDGTPVIEIAWRAQPRIDRDRLRQRWPEAAADVITETTPALTITTGDTP